MKTSVFTVSDLTCPSCAQGLETAFKRVPGIYEVKLSFTSGRLRVVYDDTVTSVTSISKTISKAGYKAEEVRIS